jgi:hypothetical protein
MILAQSLDLMQIATNFGFNAALVILLLWIGRKELISLRSAIDSQTKAITTLILSMAWLPPQFKGQVEAINIEIEQRKKGGS